MTTPTAQAEGKEVNKAWFYFVLSLAILSTQTAIVMVPALLVEIAADLEVSVAVSGQLNTASFAALAVSIVAVGPLADSFGRRPVALAGILMVLVSVLGSAFAPNMEVFLALRVLGGLGGGTIPPTSVGVVSDVISPSRRAQAVGGIMGTVVLTSAIAVPLVALFADLWGWRFTFMLASILLATAFLLSWLWYPWDSRERSRDLVFFARYWALLSMGFFRVALTVIVTQRLAYWGLISFLAAYLIQAHDLSVGFVALPLLIAGAAQVIGSYAAGFVATRSYRVALMAITTAVGGVCVFLFFAVDFGLWPAIALATAGSGLLSVLAPVMVAATTEYSGESKATGASTIGVGNFAGGALGAGLAGALLAIVGYEGIGYLCLALTTGSALLLAVFARQLRVNTG
jgi:predicted MFS family arabinose efflux permease